MTLTYALELSGVIVCSIVIGMLIVDRLRMRTLIHGQVLTSLAPDKTIPQ